MTNQVNNNQRPLTKDEYKMMLHYMSMLNSTYGKGTERPRIKLVGSLYRKTNEKYQNLRHQYTTYGVE